MLAADSRGGFAALGIPSALLEQIGRLKFTTPTPIQEQAIPIALDGQDVIGIAQTGTGKTLAFGVPMIANLRDGEFGLVLAPTRELAVQIDETFRKLGVRTAVLIGGAPMKRQIAQINARPRVMIATPGRLIDHLSQRTLRLDRVGVVVLDEADRMLDMGFAPDIRRILDLTPTNRQTMLFSATMPSGIADLAQRYLVKPARVEIAQPGTVADRVEQELYVVEREDKPALLRRLLEEHRGRVLVFARTRWGAHKLAKAVRAYGHTAAELHSDRTLAQRHAALHGFRTGEYRVLVATDIAARGLDVKDIELVINYDIPTQPEDYVHRIGRTARAGAAGLAITFVQPDQHRDVRDIEKLMDAPIAVSASSELQLPARAVVALPKKGAPGARKPSRYRPRRQPRKP